MKRMQLLGLCLLLSTSTAQAVEPKINPKTLSPDMVSNTKAKTANINFKALHRLDFIITGKSCAVCLLKIQKRLNETTGVVKVAVMLRRLGSFVRLTRLSRASLRRDSTRISEAVVTNSSAMTG